MNHVIIFFFLLINYGKKAIGTETHGININNKNENEENEIEEKWRLYQLETNPFIDLKHPNFNGDFIRCIDEYYIYETKEYNAYKKERFKNIKNYKSFEKKQFNCALNLFVHGRPNSRNSNDYKIWSASANIIKHEAMLKKKYSKYIIYTPFISLSNFLGAEGLYTHLNYAFLLSNRFSLTLKNMLEDDTCADYDIFIHSHCYGANIVRLMFTLDKNIWELLNTSFVNLTYEREVLSILDDNFKLTLKDINIVTDKSNIQYRKDPYFKTNKYYLYKSFQPKLNKKKLTEYFDDIFDDYNVKYDVLKDTNNVTKSLKENIDSIANIVDQSGGYSEENVEEDQEDKEESDSDDDFFFVQKTKNLFHKPIEKQVNRSMKRLHKYLLNKKFNLLSITSTGPPLCGIVSNMEDIRVGHQKLMKYKFLFKNMPSFLRGKLMKTRDGQELLHVVNPGLLCTMAVNEKINYNYDKDEGSLISYFQNVNYYSDLDNDELMSMHTSLGLHSTLHMRSLSYYILNFRNEYYHRTYSIPVHLSNINVSNNYAFFEYIKKNNVCSQIKQSNIEKFVSYLNEVINYDQKPTPYIPHRHVYKNPFLEHYVIPYMQENNIYTPHSILGTGRTCLLLFSYDIYKHIAMTGFSDKNVIKNDLDYLYDADPFIYYNWLTYIGNQNNIDSNKFTQDVYVYSDNINMNLVNNLINVFASTHYVKFFIFSKNNTANIYRNLNKTLKSFSLPTNKIVLRRQQENKINFPLLKNTEFHHEENVIYEYISRYTNFLKNFSYHNSFEYITNEHFILNHKTFKQYHKGHVDNLKNEIKKAHKFIQENQTFTDMKHKLSDMYNIENTPNSNERENETNEELGDLSTFGATNTFEGNSSSSGSYTSLHNMGSEYITYDGIYLHIKRSKTLREAFRFMASYNDMCENVQYIEFVMKSSAYNDIEEHLSNLDEVNTCLFNKNEDIELSYISKFCNYDQQAYFHIKKLYTSRRIYVLKSLKNCNHPKYRHLKLCENTILLKTFFDNDINVTLSKLHDREKTRMVEMRNAIEKNISQSDILSISNDSLAAVFHNKNEDITNFKINVCFIIPQRARIQNLFSTYTDKKSSQKETGLGGGSSSLRSQTESNITFSNRDNTSNNSGSTTTLASSISGDNDRRSSMGSVHSLESIDSFGERNADRIDFGFDMNNYMGMGSNKSLGSEKKTGSNTSLGSEKKTGSNTSLGSEKKTGSNTSLGSEKKTRSNTSLGSGMKMGSYTRLGKNNNTGDSVFCTQVTLPVLLRSSIMKSIHDIYIRAIRNIMKNSKFRKAFNLRDGEEWYESFIYFFDKFAYVYDKRNNYERAGDIKTFNTPQNIKWNYFYYLLKHDSRTNYNNESFLKKFFYGKESHLVKPQKDNVLKEFLTHFTIFLYLFKMD
ncbi:hypothetical protein, conserved [Plasmodium gonderi]|uniref:Uncharacterized protein n=1 Tax=Plasmodium gonderi TaxID=77519 RepID=A0A1Y1JRL7_PLAGO|nr:hypothetical protein, conserved [Plasmodium gonderi]GAW83482.1 hypothetical protein, conserved [Plasmodium gonderi]